MARYISRTLLLTLASNLSRPFVRSASSETGRDGETQSALPLAPVPAELVTESQAFRVVMQAQNKP